MPIFQLCNIFVEIFIFMRILGMGNALIDVLATLRSDVVIQEVGLLKGGMELIDIDRLKKIKQLFSSIHTSQACGGSAANAIAGLTHLGISTGFIGKIGNDDLGKFYEQDLLENGIVSHLQKSDAHSGCAMTFISPDGERTFGTYLGAAATLSAADLSAEMFRGYDLLHIEGYLVQDPALIRKAVLLAKNEGLKISLDMASYNVIRQQPEFSKELVTDYADIVFANEEEAFAFKGKLPREAAGIIAEQCEIAIVKCGKDGSIIQQGDICLQIDALSAQCIDSTGAGDLYAAGFLYGLANGCTLEQSGRIGTILAGNVIEVIGPRMDNERWNKIKLKVNALLEA